MANSTESRVAVAIGANKGKPLDNMRRGILLLQQGGLTVAGVSSVYETDPVDCEPGTPPFLNAAITGAWPGTPLRLLNLCKQIEQRLGRPARHSRRAARAIDLDLALFDDLILREDRLTVPHPLLCARLFVLVPLAEICADWNIPGAGCTVGEACRRLVECTDRPHERVRRLASKRLA